MTAEANPAAGALAEDLKLLADLPVAHLRITARALDPIELPLHSASSIRGAFGHSLLKLVCIMPPDQRDCPGCGLRSTCAYPQVFEPGSLPAPLGADFTAPPRPYVIRNASARSIEPDSTFSWEMIVIGRARERLVELLLTWATMGEQGIGQRRGRFELGRVDHLTGSGDAEVIYQAEDGIMLAGVDLQTAPPRASIEDECLAVRLISPTAIKVGGRFVDRPVFGHFWRSLQRRLSALRGCYGAGWPQIDYRAAIAAADQVSLVHWGGEGRRWERYSRRQGSRISMSGLAGDVVWNGDLAPFLPAIQLGALVAVGDNCAFGQGVYEITTLNRARSGLSRLSAGSVQPPVE